MASIPIQRPFGDVKPRIPDGAFPGMPNPIPSRLPAAPMPEPPPPSSSPSTGTPWERRGGDK
jgi:hypothetical protein